ncbi:uncharacterized protein PV06_02781 [Exophiala oligosperma]|uniref:Cytochrome b mRNA-processing protein 4 n=2 Tax=Exophiala oligosperma TaxID=215243 RepID=A0A0D2DX09_9EURO|nr:uncharacterized protein PV06_02781 [Exophiala oligosperma]KIW47185.1 hypothetical protein PV06_02781 [Exophiala oligosperma]
MASRGGMYAKMAAVFLTCCIGGPALMYYVTPSEGEVFKRFSPDLQKRNLELRDQRTKDYEVFLGQLKEYSKSDKPIWTAAAEAQAKAREELQLKETQEKALQQKMREEMRAAQAQGR